jgi:phage N-6-adenine-methyltransferase
MSGIERIRSRSVGLAKTSVPTATELTETIRQHIAEGDRLADRAEQHYRAAGRLLITLKETTTSWAEWEALLRDNGIGKSRASELMQIGDGRKTLAEVRLANAERVWEHEHGFSVSNGEPRRPALFGSGNDRWFTPCKYIDAAREVLGEIDCDPFSEVAANETVRAARYFTRSDDGLKQHWSGRVYSNPPYSRGLLQQFATKLIARHRAGDLTSAIALVPAAADCGWFQTLLAGTDAVCFVRGRVRFVRPDDGVAAINSAIQGSAFIYIGGAVDKFTEVFGAFGSVMVHARQRND